MEKSCISCGMPLRTPEDFPGGDETKTWCCHCANPDGTLQSYDARLTAMAGFITRTQGADPEAARDLARALMAKLPAWQNRS